MKRIKNFLETVRSKIASVLPIGNVRASKVIERIVLKNLQCEHHKNEFNEFHSYMGVKMSLKYEYNKKYKIDEAAYYRWDINYTSKRGNKYHCYLEEPVFVFFTSIHDSTNHILKVVQHRLTKWEKADEYYLP